MTIYNGCDGSLNLYYKGLLISSFPLTKKKTFEREAYGIIRRLLYGK